MLFSSNPKTFKNWPQLRYDILFNGLTVIEASKKYEVTTAAISAHLKKFPRIKRAYYERPWAERQLKLEWLDPQCKFAREVIDDYYTKDYPPIHQFDDKYFNEALEHRANCVGCQLYQKEQLTKADAPYRLDCPPIAKLVQHLRPHAEEIVLDAKTRKSQSQSDILITEHLLVCNFCRGDLYYFQKYTIRDLIPLIKREESLYQKDGWRRLLSADDFSIIQQLAKAHPDFLGVKTEDFSRPVAKFIKWSRFRKWAMQPRSI